MENRGTVRVRGADKLLAPDTRVKDAFDATFLSQYSSYNILTLEQALNLPGGQLNNLLKAAIASLLNSSELPTPIIDYSFIDDQVYDITRDAHDSQYLQNIVTISDNNDTEEKNNFLDAANNNNICGYPRN